MTVKRPYKKVPRWTPKESMEYKMKLQKYNNLKAEINSIIHRYIK